MINGNLLRAIFILIDDHSFPESGCWLLDARRSRDGRASYTELVTMTGFIIDFLSTKVCFL